jgi:hypothetical protein
MALTAAAAVPRAAFVLPTSAVGPLLYWVFISSMVCYSILTSATKYLPATNVAAFICLQPLAGSALALLWLGERLSSWDMGAVLILAGLICVLRDGGARHEASIVPSMSLNGAGPLLGVGGDSQGSTVSLADWSGDGSAENGWMEAGLRSSMAAMVGGDRLTKRGSQHELLFSHSGGVGQSDEEPGRGS